MKRYITIIALFFLLGSCKPISKDNKVAVVGKIIDHPLASRNGSKSIVYYYLGKVYEDVSSFDARYFNYGDKFILLIDKTDPKKNEIPRPTIRYVTEKDFRKVETKNYYLDENDLKSLNSFQ